MQRVKFSVQETIKSWYNKTLKLVHVIRVIQLWKAGLVFKYLAEL